MPDVSLSGIEFKIKGSTDSASSSIDSLISKLSQLKTALNASSSVRSLSTSLKSLKTSTAKVLPGISNFISSLKRIAYYRFIRTIIKSMTSAFSEGMTNAYQFSKVVGYDLADALDTLTTKSFTMKNQLGAAFGALITALEPILLQIISLVTRAANVITRFIALLSGKDTYLKATDSAQEYASAVGSVGEAAEEAMHYLAPFDELNVLSDNSSGSGSGSSSSTDYTDMFEETPVMQNLSDFEASLALSFNDVLVDWDDLTGEQIAEKVLAGLFTLTGAGVGFILGGVPGAIVGSLIGLTLGLIADAFIFDHDGVLSSSEIAHSLQYVLNALAGGVIGFTVGGVGGALIGASIALGISLVLDALSFSSGDSTVNTSVLLDQFTVALGALVGGVIGFTVGGPAGALIGAVIGIGVTGVITSLKFNKQDGLLSGESGRTGLDYFIVDVLGLPSDDDWKNWGENIWKSISNGVTAGFHWLTDGISDLKQELYNIFILPIVQAFDEFAENYPKIASWLGIESTGSTGGGASSGFGNTSISVDVTANATDMTDSIPPDSKIIDRAKAIAKEFGDSVPVSQKVIDNAKANVKDVTDSIPSNKKGIDMSADLYTWRKTGELASNTSDNWTGLGLYANLFSWRKTGDLKNNTSEGWTGIPLYANLWSWRKTGEFKTSTSEGWTGIGMYANFNNWRDNLKDPWSYITAYGKWFKEYWKNGTPEVEVDAHAQSLTFDNDTTVGGSIHFGGASRALGGIFKNGAWSNIPQFASGGRPHGSLFLAGEAGAEVVGHVGGRTEVLNRSQLAATMYAAVKSAIASVGFHVSPVMPSVSDDSGGMSEEMIYRAMLRALNDSDVFPDEIDLDGEVVYRQMVRRNKLATAMSGLNPMMATG